MKLIRAAALGAALSFGLVAGSITPATGAQGMDASYLLALVEPDITIVLNGTADAGLQGEARLEAVGEQTELAIEVAGAAAGASLTGFLIAGTCGEGGEVIAPLGAITVDAEGTGRLNASLPVALEVLTAQPISVALLPEGGAPTEALACGAYTPAAEAEPLPEPAPEPAPQPLPEPQPEEPQPLPEPDPADPEPTPEPEEPEATEPAEPQAR